MRPRRRIRRPMHILALEPRLSCCGRLQHDALQHNVFARRNRIAIEGPDCRVLAASCYVLEGDTFELDGRLA